MAMPGKAQPDLNEIEKGFIELLDKIRAGARLATKAPDAQEGLPANGQGDLFLVIDHEGVTVGVARDRRNSTRSASCASSRSWPARCRPPCSRSFSLPWLAAG